MSRVGKKPINIKDVELTQGSGELKVKGKLGELSTAIHPNIQFGWCANNTGLEVVTKSYDYPALRITGI